MIFKYDISDLRPLIAWPYFNYAWGVAKASDVEKESLRKDAEAMLDKWQRRHHSISKILDLPAYSVGDDIIIGDVVVPMLRQQTDEFLSLADFVMPKELGVGNIGVFATTFGDDIPELKSADYYESMMSQVLCDRLAEATAEKVSEEMPGIRPAVGYPSIPDMSINFIIDKIIDFSSIGIKLTETGMMIPHASVSGLIFPHPRAHYFNISKIGEDQLIDYAARRGYSIEEMRKFIRNN